MHTAEQKVAEVHAQWVASSQQHTKALAELLRMRTIWARDKQELEGLVASLKVWGALGLCFCLSLESVSLCRYICRLSKEYIASLYVPSKQP